MDDVTRKKFNAVVNTHLEVQRAIWAICDLLKLNDPDQSFEEVEEKAIQAIDNLILAFDAAADVWYLTYIDSDEELDEEEIAAIKTEVAGTLGHIKDMHLTTRQGIPSFAALTTADDIRQIYDFAAIFGENADDIEKWLIES